MKSETKIKEQLDIETQKVEEKTKETMAIANGTLGKIPISSAGKFESSATAFLFLVESQRKAFPTATRAFVLNCSL